MYTLAPYIPLLPFIGFLLNGLVGRRLKSERTSGLVGSGVVGLAFVVAVAILLDMVSAPPDDRSHVVRLFTWVAAGSLSVDAAFLVDQLSVIMILIVTGVGFLIHVYSIGYMRGDPAFPRFFAYLNLFEFMMLILVLANNFLLTFLGWEGVGLCSYLLIGFWHDRPFDTGGYKPGTATASDAAKKAFIVNRIGDFGFMVAMFLIFKSFGSLAYEDVLSRAGASSAMGSPTMFWITLLLFLGATGKSAQIPLFVWLPDAMAGPTPVSALIHAATMVTAGVYIVARCAVLYSLAPLTMEIVAVVGTATAILAATMALVQNDIKKILAYSTISQLGYMFLALGVGAFTAGIFHVMTHAFFKALLFLGAGAVIHAMHEEQNIQRMGGLKSHMPVTHKTFLIAALAIAGIPPLSGFFSKDEILWKAFSQGSLFYWVFGWAGAALTAFYMFRLVTLVFDKTGKWSHDVHPHEAPKVMTIPLIVLAVLSIVGGFAGIPQSLGGSNLLERWLEPVFERATMNLTLAPEGSRGLEYGMMALSVAVGLAGIFAARRVYLKRDKIHEGLSGVFGAMYNLLLNKYFIDEVYDAAVVRPIVRGSEKLLWKWFDVSVIDGIVNGTARLVSRAGQLLRRLQSGTAQAYALTFVVGIIVILAFLALR